MNTPGSGTGSGAGRSSSRVLPRGFSIEEALGVAIQMADALDKAHSHGIIHRDLKPANVMLSKSGASRPGSPQVKLLDFGLAKWKAPLDSLASAVTAQADLTVKGAVLGTMRYMAPEQLEGGEADARTDIFAFGTILYEVITGKKAFDGKNQPSLAGAIMTAEPIPIARAATAHAAAARARRQTVPRERSGRPVADRARSADSVALDCRAGADRRRSGRRRIESEGEGLARARRHRPRRTADGRRGVARVSVSSRASSEGRVPVPRAGVRPQFREHLDLARWPDDRAGGAPEHPGGPCAVHAPGRRREVPARGRQRGRFVAVLVARRQVGGFRRRRQVEARGGGGRPPSRTSAKPRVSPAARGTRRT